MRNSLWRNAKAGLKKSLEKLRCYALEHNINPRTFIWLYVTTLVIKWSAVGLGAAGIVSSNRQLSLAFLIINRSSALVVPIYVLARSTRHHWSVYIIYLLFLAIGTIGIERLFGLFK